MCVPMTLTQPNPHPPSATATALPYVTCTAPAVPAVPAVQLPPPAVQLRALHAAISGRLHARWAAKRYDLPDMVLLLNTAGEAAAEGGRRCRYQPTLNETN